MADTNITKKKYVLDIVKFRYFWLGLSMLFLLPCIVAIIYLSVTQPNHAPLKLGIDFTGGTILQYSSSKSIDTKELGVLREKLENIGVQNPVIQTTVNQNPTEDKDKSLTNLISIRTTFLGDKEGQKKVNEITQVISSDVENSQLVQVNSVGPTLGSELLKNTLIALIFSFIVMVIYISFRFKTEYGWIALIALFHDTLFVVGIFALKGIFFSTTIDSLFITAILTVIGYSINDTIVVFDRVRENMRFLAKKMTTSEIINASINQTLARSINTSATTLFTLFALYLFGGSTIKDFVLAIIIGIAVGSYSSIFVAGSLLSIVKDKMSKKHV